MFARSRTGMKLPLGFARSASALFEIIRPPESMGFEECPAGELGFCAGIRTVLAMSTGVGVFLGVALFPGRLFFSIVQLSQAASRCPSCVVQ
jgi:hypothetical protein